MTVHGDEYLDRDTFELTTGERTNELALRLHSGSTTADLDFVVFDEALMKPVVISNLTSATTLEVATFAVRPSTKYLVWVGAFKTSTGPTAEFTATICGSHFF
jgi:hypothetical protein